MSRRNRECYLCGDKYAYCSNCNKKDPAWMAEFHTENCKNIFDICTRFNMQLLTKDEAKAALEQCDLVNKANFKSYVQRDLENIFAEDAPKRGKRSQLPVIDEAIPHEVVNKTENE